MFGAGGGRRRGCLLREGRGHPRLHAVREEWLLAVYVHFITHSTCLDGMEDHYHYLERFSLQHAMN